MKKLLMLTLIATISVSCSSIENATEKWKTPDAPNAGLEEGEKSSYLLNKEKEEAPVVKPSTDTKKIKKKTTKKKK